MGGILDLVSRCLVQLQSLAKKLRDGAHGGEELDTISFHIYSFIL